tara:strand:- start:638 stop:940 length:303 start_codon:yes stop_codon:yes gene_type:complete
MTAYTEEEICSKCHTDEDVEQCMECDKYFCIDCDPNEMATYGQGHSCSTMCQPCSLNFFVEEEDNKVISGIKDAACEFWIEWNYMVGKPGYENRVEWLDL